MQRRSQQSGTNTGYPLQDFVVLRDMTEPPEQPARKLPSSSIHEKLLYIRGFGCINPEGLQVIDSFFFFFFTARNTRAIGDGSLTTAAILTPLDVV